jgi:histidinol-phosphate/aromatic aminotransferase/cobyric acid decarboxylase-like protein
MATDGARPPPQPDPGACAHGGAFFDAVGTEFGNLHARAEVVNADVLDAWFDPAPAVVEALREHLPWLLKTSPPTHAEGLVRVIARTRGLSEAAILPAGGSSELIYLALPRWVARGERVLLVDPSYGEYEHLLARVLGADVRRVALRREDGWALDPEALARAIDAERPGLVALVNPASPTGRHVDMAALAAVLARVPRATTVWIDETYVEYAGPDQSLEALAAARPNVVVSKSMSKVYALSGVRAAYLVAAPERLRPLRAFLPPWSVGLLAQVAAVRALEDRVWYPARWQETHALRAELTAGLERLGCEVTPSCTGFVLVRLPPHAPPAPRTVSALAARGVFVRDLSTLGAALGERYVRVAVKERATQARVLAAFADVLRAGA